MDLLHNLGIGFGVALTAQSLLYALFGAALGTLIGVLPGIGPVAMIALLLPALYALDATPALIMLAAVYYGAQFGASTTAILLKVPGESISGVTAIDGCQMARQGRAGSALSVAAIGSFFAGCVGTLVIAVFASPLAELAFRFGPAEYFSLMVLRLGRAAGRREVVKRGVRSLWPTMHDFREAWPSVLRGTALGSVLVLLAGSGALLASFASYAAEKKLTRDARIHFGKGAIQGVAGPESANHAAAQTSFIPMLAFGIPPNAVMALMIGAMVIKGIHPGPQVMTSQPQLFWGLIASMWVGNLMLLVLNLPLAGLWGRLLTVPYRLLFPAIVLLGCIGVYALGQRTFDVYLMALFAFIGYVFFKLGCEAAPLLLGFILEPMMEENLRRALLFSGGDWKTFVTRPLSSGLLVAAALLIVIVTLPSIKQKREAAFQED